MATPTTLPSTFTAGAVLTAAQMNNLRGAFRILQVVSMTSSSYITGNTATFSSTNMTQAITPSATTSKILVVANMGGIVKGAESAGNGTSLRLARGGTGIHDIGPVNFTNTATLLIVSACLIFLDSPATTAATTYTVEQKNQGVGSTSGVQYNGATSSLTLFEISA